MSVDQGISIRVFPARTRTARRAAVRSLAPVRIWLWGVAACIVLMVVVGGATRLTESGLSITEWEPLFGAIPPLSAAAWNAKFEAYRQIPQFTLHVDMTLGEFKTIFFWEWSHRFIGRMLGLIIALPLAWFWITGRLSRRLQLQSLGLLVLVGLQGAVGWWMVKSGLTERTEVSQYRLATHLLLATFTLAYVVWIAAGLKRVSPDTFGPRAGSIRFVSSALLVLVFCQIGLGALVAGLRAGLVHNTWPLMDGHFVPAVRALFFDQPLWRNLFENATTVQFQHRMVAYLVFAVAIAHVAQLLHAAPGSAAVKRAVVLAGLVLCQALIGIATLLFVVPLGAALAHQAFAMVVLTKAVMHRRRLSQAVAASA